MSQIVFDSIVVGAVIVSGVLITVCVLLLVVTAIEAVMDMKDDYYCEDDWENVALALQKCSLFVPRGTPDEQ